MPTVNTEQEHRLLEQFCINHHLPEHYKAMASDFFLPLAKEIAEQAHSRKTPLFVGINGSQGSGKSTLADLLSQLLTNIYHKRVCNLSIDDFYHTRATRQRLAETVHPLFATRGAPGTHDIDLLQSVLKNLHIPDQTVAIPRFNKAVDDRHLASRWDSEETPVDIIILEGWCVGVEAQSEQTLKIAVNDLEANEDSALQWRTAVNDTIKERLQPLFRSLDHLIMLKAPSFDCVFEWRQTQEQKLKATLSQKDKQSGVMDDRQLLRFIQHYQRLTEHLLDTLPLRANSIFHLSTQHDIIERTNND